MAILRIDPLLDLNTVLPIKERIIKTYGTQVKDTRTLKSVFNTNQGYRTCKFPTIEVEGGLQLDTKCRYFTEDIPYGLCILKDLAQIMNVHTPAIDSIITFHQKFMNVKYIKDGRLIPEMLEKTGCPSKYGIKTPMDLIKRARFEF